MFSISNTLRDVAKGCLCLLVFAAIALVLAIWGLSCVVKYIWWRWHE